MCCKRFALSGHKNIVSKFLLFAAGYEEKVRREERDHFFGSKLERLEWRDENRKSTEQLYGMFWGSRRDTLAEDVICKGFLVAEETYGFATTLYGVCAKRHHSHVFRVDAEKIGADVRRGFHASARGKCYSINYKMAAAIQQMGCGSADVATLAGFLELPSSGSSVVQQLKTAEQVMGSIQIATRKLSEIEAVREEIKAHEENNDLLTHACTIKGFEHPPLPMLKGSYGK